MDKLFMAVYSSWDGNDIISVHKTKEGAYLAIKEDKKKRLEKHNRIFTKSDDVSFDSMDYSWHVSEIEIKD